MDVYDVLAEKRKVKQQMEEEKKSQEEIHKVMRNYEARVNEILRLNSKNDLC